jgi:hypothetical protein
MVSTLIAKKLVKAVGQKEVPGRPTLYGTTNEFLIHFGLNKLSDLPAPTKHQESVVYSRLSNKKLHFTLEFTYHIRYPYCIFIEKKQYFTPVLTFALWTKKCLFFDHKFDIIL